MTYWDNNNKNKDNRPHVNNDNDSPQKFTQKNIWC